MANEPAGAPEQEPGAPVPVPAAQIPEAAQEGSEGQETAAPDGAPASAVDVDVTRSEQQMIASIGRRFGLARSILGRFGWHASPDALWPSQAGAESVPMVAAPARIPARSAFLSVASPGHRTERAVTSWAPEELFWWNRLAPAARMLGQRHDAPPPVLTRRPPPDPPETPIVRGEAVPPGAPPSDTPPSGSSPPIDSLPSGASPAAERSPGEGNQPGDGGEGRGEQASAWSEVDQSNTTVTPMTPLSAPSGTIVAATTEPAAASDPVAAMREAAAPPSWLQVVVAQEEGHNSPPAWQRAWLAFWDRLAPRARDTQDGAPGSQLSAAPAPGDSPASPVHPVQTSIQPGAPAMHGTQTTGAEPRAPGMAAPQPQRPPEPAPVSAPDSPDAQGQSFSLQVPPAPPATPSLPMSSEEPASAAPALPGEALPAGPADSRAIPPDLWLMSSLAEAGIWAPFSLPLPVLSAVPGSVPVTPALADPADTPAAAGEAQQPSADQPAAIVAEAPGGGAPPPSFVHAPGRAPFAPSADAPPGTVLPASATTGVAGAPAHGLPLTSDASIPISTGPTAAAPSPPALDVVSAEARAMAGMPPFTPAGTAASHGSLGTPVPPASPSAGAVASDAASTGNPQVGPEAAPEAVPTAVPVLAALRGMLGAAWQRLPFVTAPAARASGGAPGSSGRTATGSGGAPVPASTGWSGTGDQTGARSDSGRIDATYGAAPAPAMAEASPTGAVPAAVSAGAGAAARAVSLAPSIPSVAPEAPESHVAPDVLVAPELLAAPGALAAPGPVIAHTPWRLVPGDTTPADALIAPLAATLARQHGPSDAAEWGALSTTAYAVRRLAPSENPSGAGAPGIDHTGDSTPTGIVDTPPIPDTLTVPGGPPSFFSAAGPAASSGTPGTPAAIPSFAPPEVSYGPGRTLREAPAAPAHEESLPARPVDLGDEDLARILMSLPPAMASQAIAAGLLDQAHAPPPRSQAPVPPEPVGGMPDIQRPESPRIGTEMVFAPALARRPAREHDATVAPSGSNARPGGSAFGTSGSVARGAGMGSDGSFTGSNAFTGAALSGSDGVSAAGAPDSLAGISRAALDRDGVIAGGGSPDWVDAEYSAQDEPEEVPVEEEDLDRLADEVFDLLRWRLRSERERSLL